MDLQKPELNGKSEAEQPKLRHYVAQRIAANLFISVDHALVVIVNAGLADERELAR